MSSWKTSVWWFTIHLQFLKKDVLCCRYRGQICKQSIGAIRVLLHARNAKRRFDTKRVTFFINSFRKHVFPPLFNGRLLYVPPRRSLRFYLV